RDLNGLVKLGVFHFLQQRHRVTQEVLALLHGVARLADVLSCFATHFDFSLSPTASGSSPQPWCYRFSAISNWPLAMSLSRDIPALANCHLLIANCYPMTSIPIDRAVPLTLLIAVSSEAAFRSGIFCLAMSATCFSVTLPTLSLLGAPEPLAIPSARFNSTDAGGVLVIKVKERSV